MSVSLLCLQNNYIALFYLRKRSTEDCISIMRISKDEAKSWSDAVPNPPDIVSQEPELIEMELHQRY
jgi:hypothetical protein